MDSEDDETQLPADTLHILQQFLKEKAERENNEKILDSNDENINFEENWVINNNLIKIRNTNNIYILATESVLVLWKY